MHSDVWAVLNAEVSRIVMMNDIKNIFGVGQCGLIIKNKKIMGLESTAKLRSE
jgi:hypothetical protein